MAGALTLPSRYFWCTVRRPATILGKRLAAVKQGPVAVAKGPQRSAAAVVASATWSEDEQRFLQALREAGL